MENDKRIPRDIAPILENLQEHVHQIQRLILEKEPTKERRTQLAKTILRRVRALAHAGDFVDVEVIKDAPKLAEIFQFVWERMLPLNEELFSLLFATDVGMKDAGMRFREHQDLTDCALAATLPHLDAMIREAGSQLSLPSAIECPLCNSVIVRSAQLDRSTLWKMVCNRSLGAIFHDLKNCAAVVEIYSLKLKIPAGQAPAHMESVRRLSKFLLHDGRSVTAPIQEIERVHQDLSDFFRFDFRIDGRQLDRRLNLDIEGYFCLVFAILQETLVIAGRISNPKVELRLEVRDTTIVGQVALSADAEIEIGSGNWRLAYLIAAAHGATLHFNHQSGVLVIQWIFPTASKGASV